MLDHPGAPLIVILAFIFLFGITSDYLNAKARTDAPKVCVASLSECDAYWEKTP